MWPAGKNKHFGQIANKHDYFNKIYNLIMFQYPSLTAKWSPIFPVSVGTLHFVTRLTVVVAVAVASGKGERVNIES